MRGSQGKWDGLVEREKRDELDNNDTTIAWNVCPVYFDCSMWPSSVNTVDLQCWEWSKGAISLLVPQDTLITDVLNMHGDGAGDNHSPGLLSRSR